MSSDTAPSRTAAPVKPKLVLPDGTELELTLTIHETDSEDGSQVAYFETTHPDLSSVQISGALTFEDPADVFKTLMTAAAK